MQQEKNNPFGNSATVTWVLSRGDAPDEEDGSKHPTPILAV